MLNLSAKLSTDGIVYLSPVNDEFELKYLAVRKKEGYLFSANDVRELPVARSNSGNWKLRAQSAERINTYISKKATPITVLELGCGNGWFSNYISKNANVTQVFGLDVNQFELRLAYEAFGSNSKLQWIYADIFNADIPKESFDLIILNSSVHYFPDLTKLLLRLKELLNANGEIHILDSPFYKTIQDQKSAAERTVSYFSSLGFPELSKHYTPHLFQQITAFHPEVMYRPSFLNRIKRKLLLNSAPINPFFWFKLH